MGATCYKDVTLKVGTLAVLVSWKHFEELAKCVFLKVCVCWERWWKEMHWKGKMPGEKGESVPESRARHAWNKLQLKLKRQIKEISWFSCGQTCYCLLLHYLGTSVTKKKKKHFNKPDSHRENIICSGTWWITRVGWSWQSCKLLH